MVMMFVGGVVLMFEGILILFLPYDIYGEKSLLSCLAVEPILVHLTSSVPTRASFYGRQHLQYVDRL